MVVITDSCVGCGLCVKYCPVGAISLDEEERRSIVDQNLCVECGTCYRASVCPVEAIEHPDLPYPRSIRRHFSDPTSRHVVTGIPGRGTEEIKTNDVTGRFERGMVGFCVEVGRPGVGTSIREVERFTRTLSRLGAEYEERNPLTPMFSNREAGEFKEELLDERVLSIIIEFIVPEAEVPAVLMLLKGMSEEVNTVFSLGMAARIPEDGGIPLRDALERLGMEPRPNAKINLGMGRRPEGG